MLSLSLSLSLSSESTVAMSSSSLNSESSSTAFFLAALAVRLGAAATTVRRQFAQFQLSQCYVFNINGCFPHKLNYEVITSMKLTKTLETTLMFALKVRICVHVVTY